MLVNRGMPGGAVEFGDPLSSRGAEGRRMPTGRVTAARRLDAWIAVEAWGTDLERQCPPLQGIPFIGVSSGCSSFTQCSQSAEDIDVIAISICSSWDIGISAAPAMGIMQTLPSRTWAAKPMLVRIFTLMNGPIVRAPAKKSLHVTCSHFFERASILRRHKISYFRQFL